MFRVEPLGAAELTGAASLIASEQVFARSKHADLTMEFTDRGSCRAALAGLLDDGHIGVVAIDGGRVVGVLCGKVRGNHALLRAEGLAVDPQLEDATGVLGALYAALASSLLAAGAVHHHVTHVDLESVGTGLNNLGFGRSSVYATQAARPAATATRRFEVRIGTPEELPVIVALSALEMGFRFTPPIYALPHASSREHLVEQHSRLFDQGAIHLLARSGRQDVGLATLEFTSPSPRLCPAGQPYIGPTATHPSMRGQGVGRALVESALDWAHQHDFRTVSVDFDSANPISRPFWLGAGFQPTGYQLTRNIDPTYSGSS